MTAAIDEGPIPFTDALVRKVIADEKTETRRVVPKKLWPLIEEIERVNGKLVWQCADFDLKCRYDHEQLWLKEVWGPRRGFGLPEIAGTKPSLLDESEEIIYRATDPWGEKLPVNLKSNWRPPMFMCRWMSRIDLRVKEILLERVQDITEEGAKAEGVEPIPVECVCGATGYHLGDKPSYRYGFEKIWDEINSKRGFGWESNPPVWVVRFSRITKCHGLKA